MLQIAVFSRAERALLLVSTPFLSDERYTTGLDYGLNTEIQD